MPLALQLDAVQARHPAASAAAAPALRGLSLAVAPGEAVAVIGPSGAGKTTLLQVMACSLRPSEGQVVLSGIDPWHVDRGALKRLRSGLFLAPQVPPLPPRQRVITAVMAARLPVWGVWASLRALLWPPAAEADRAWQALRRFDLGDKLYERVDRLSGGERQRVGLARALVAPASLWLIDEPLSALDPARAGQALQVLRGEAAAANVALVATLHQVELALAHFPRIVGLRDGRLAFDLPASQVGEGHLAALYAQHEHERHAAAVPAESLAQAPLAAQPVVVHCR